MKNIVAYLQHLSATYLDLVRHKTETHSSFNAAYLLYYYYTGVYFGSYEYFRLAFANKEGELSAWRQIAAGGLAGTQSYERLMI
jgi:hypothetical protein